ncbi:MAG: hypothetical protein ACP5OG_03845 [Candidatus Nanoarchaeia archaeon]
MEVKIKEKRSELTQLIRDYSHFQKELWRKIPYLALEADGRRGYSDSCSLAYASGFWPISASCNEGCYEALVDLENGNLVSPDIFSTNGESFYPCPDKGVLKLAFSLDEIDAGKLIKTLEKEIQIQDNNEAKKLREENRKKYGITKLYSRKK